MGVARIIPSSQIPDVVTFNILVNGRELPLTLPVIEFLIQREVNKIPFARIRISDGDPALEDFPISNEEYFLPGNEIEIKLGYRSDNATVFKGIVITHSNKVSRSGGELIVECRDKSVRLTIGRKNRHYENVTDSDVAESIIDSYGLDKDIEPMTAYHGELLQYDTSDWDFMLSRIDVAGKICLVEDGKIIIKKPELLASPVLELLYGATMIDYSAEIDSRTQYSEVISRTWNYGNQEIVEDTGDEPEINIAGNIQAGDLTAVASPESYTLLHSGKLSNEALKHLADSKMLKSRLSRIRGKVRFQGYPELIPGDIISINGVGERFNGPVFVSSIRHEFVGGNWTTEAIFGMSENWFAERLYPNCPTSSSGVISSVQGLQIGIVTDIVDPEGEARVKVRLPIVSDSEEGIWMRIATLDAGNNRGTFFMPEIGDEVVVGFISNNPSSPVILGKLYSSTNAPPLTPSASNDEKGYVSRAETKLIFNDGEGSLTIEDRNGNKIKMEPSGITIESAAELKLKGANVKIEGSASAEIKGGMVKIN